MENPQHQQPQLHYHDGKQRFVKPQILKDSDSEDDSASYTNSSDLSEDSLDDGSSWHNEAMRTGELFYIEEDLPLDEIDESVAYDAASNNQNDHGVSRKGRSIIPYVTKTILVPVEAASHYGHKFSTDLLASMLGIITLDMRLDNQSDTSEDSSYEKLSVDVLVPGGAALQTGQVNLGDILRAVNEVPVTINNVEKVLRSVTQPCDLKLLFQVDQNNIENFKEIVSMHKLPSKNTDDVSIIHLLSPAEDNAKSSQLPGPHGVMFLTMNIKSDTAGDDDDLLYNYPSSDSVSTPISKLLQIRGVFITLSDMMKDNFSCSVLSSSLMVENQLVHCAYYSIGSEILIICVPGSSFTVAHVQKVAANAVRLLNLMYGSLLSAFQPENKHRVDHLFHNILMLNSASTYERLTEPFHLTQSNYLRLPGEVSAHVNAALSEFEASDFEGGFAEKHSYTRRLYNIRGSCLFHNQHLIANHLPTEDFSDLYLFCYNHALLEPAKKDKIGLLLIWREVFRWKNRVCYTNDKADFTESKGRYFWLIVGLKKNILCVLLQMNGKLFPTAHTPRPDPLYVNQAKATLLNLESYNLQGCISQVATSSSLPFITTANNFVSKPQSLFKSAKPPTGSSGQSKGFKLPFNSPLKLRNTASDSDGEIKSTQSPKTHPKFSEDQKTPPRSRSLFREKSFSSQGSGESFGSPKPTAKLGNSQMNTSRQASMKLETDGQSKVESKYIQLTTGNVNTLFLYVNLDTAKGIAIMPTDYDINCNTSLMDQSIVENFRRYALIIQQRLAAKDGAVDECHEEGVMFQCHGGVTSGQQKKQPPHVQYWVVGRSLKSPLKQELYVCFSSSASQNMIELAFRIAAQG
uniref:protein inturned-like n=1 Tax=Ciona intestinalis TaxID=7719 RepID=UPI000180BAED|nr:protein inturned-like [Ciona intestinalis]|eukprot:XP_009862305.1 protein inturned-like [Ciona intestinalis]